MITVKCRCGTSVKMDTGAAQRALRALGPRAYGYGDHVTDPRAFVMRLLVIKYDWVCGATVIGKTTITMVCPKCKKKLPRFEPDPEDSFK